MPEDLKRFEDREIRSAWNAEEEQWYFSVVDVVAALTDSADPKQYMKKMRKRDAELNAKWGTICTPIEMLLSIRIRNDLMTEWRERGVGDDKDFAILTDDITRAWSGMSTRGYKDLKGLTKENLRDNMTDTELVPNMLAETSTTNISKREKPEGMSKNHDVAKKEAPWPPQRAKHSRQKQASQ